MAQRLRARDQRLDALVNNAAIYDGTARDIWDVYVLGPLRLTAAVAPLLARSARVVMVTSGLGRIGAQPVGLARRLSAPDLSLADLERLAREAPDGYGASKAALTAMARVFAKELEPRGILVNAISPGWVRTDMGGSSAPRSVEQGAASVLWGVGLPADGPTGGVFEDGELLRTPFEAAVRKFAPDAQFVVPEIPPVGGSLLLGLRAESVADVDHDALRSALSGELE